MLTDTADLISITEASRSLSRLTDEVAAGRRLVILRNNEPAMALVPLAQADQMDRLAERESDLRLLALALARELIDDGRRFDLDDVLSEFGVEVVDDER